MAGGEHTIKMPDVGEGVAEAELVTWHVKVGDPVREDQVIADVMTDKATVELPSPVDGTVLWLSGVVGDQIAVGAPLARIDRGGTSRQDSSVDQSRDGRDNEGSDGAGDTTDPTRPLVLRASDVSNPTGMDITDPSVRQQRGIVDAELAADVPRRGTRSSEPVVRAQAFGNEATPHANDGLGTNDVTRATPDRFGETAARPPRPRAAPSVRRRALEKGVNLRLVEGTGPGRRIGHDDLDRHLRGGGSPPAPGPDAEAAAIEEVRIVGLRRRIADRMSTAWERIPHITYVEAVSMDALEGLRAELNAESEPGMARLTVLPFLVLALARAVREQPQFNALYDDEAGVLRRHASVHVGIATQTTNGLVVPVLRHAERMDLRECATAIADLAKRARAGKSPREELSGSTVTITSLGPLGGIATTPIINHPEVAIIGTNKIRTEPHWNGTSFVPRRMMNLSSSFDHRVIDGHDAALFVQRIRTLLEAPVRIFTG